MSTPSVLSRADSARRPSGAGGFFGGERSDRLLPRLALPAILAVAAGLRLWRLDALSLWIDESWTLVFAQGGIGDIWGVDTHPPLYYALIALWRQLGEGEFLLRLPSVVASIATVWMVYLCGQALGGRTVGLLASLLQALSPFALNYAQEVRAYALLEFAVALALLGLLRLLGDPAGAAAARLRGGDRRLRGAWLLYGFGTVLALYCHNLGCLWPLAASAVVLGACLFDRSCRPLWRPWIAVNLIVLLFWLPWWPAMLQQANSIAADFWIWQPRASEVAGELAYISHALKPRLSQTEIALAPVLVALALWGCWVVRPRRTAALLLTAALLPPLVEVAIGLFGRPVFAQRTLIWTGLPAVLCSAAALAWFLQGERARWVVGVLLAALLLGVRVSAVESYFANPMKPDWRALVRQIAWEAEAGDRLLVSPDHALASYREYRRRQPFDGRPLPPEAEERFSMNVLRAVVETLSPGDRLWIVRVLSYRGFVRPEELAAEMPCLQPVRGLEAMQLQATLFVVGSGCS